MFACARWFVPAVLVAGACWDTPAVAGEENSDGLTFRQIVFSSLIGGVMDGAFQAIVTPDGADAYVSAPQSDSVVHFQRNPDGTLVFYDSVDAVASESNDPGAPYGLWVSPNGRSVYALLDSTLGGIVRYDRDLSTGSLTFGAVLPQQGELVQGLHGPIFAAQSPDGRHAYLLNDQSQLPPYYTPSIAVIATDPDTGAMALVQDVPRPSAGAGGYSSFSEVTLSLDGRHVYVAGYALGTIEIYARNPVTGALTFSDIAHGRGGTVPFIGSIAISPDGAHGYATDVTNGGLALFDRDPDSGGLTLRPGSNIALELAGRIAISPDGDRVYVTSATGISQPITIINVFARDPDTGLLTLLEQITDGVSGSLVLGGPGLAAVSPDSANYYLPAFNSTALAVFSADRPNLPCSDFPAIYEEHAAFRAQYSLGEDIDLDGLPETAALALLNEAACGSVDDGMDEAITNAYLINRAATESEFQVYGTGEWAPYQSALASLMLTSAAMRTYLTDALEPFGHTLLPNYVVVACTDGACQPANARDASHRGPNEPFSGEGDPDGDGFTNADEWSNVLARGGSAREFGVSALDPANDGTRAVSFNGSSSCFIATAAYGTPLAMELDTLRAFRDTQLLTSGAGSVIADTYYRLSPPAANFIATRPNIQAIARTAVGIGVSSHARAALSPVVALLVILVMAVLYKLHRHDRAFLRPSAKAIRRPHGSSL